MSSVECHGNKIKLKDKHHNKNWLFVMRVCAGQLLEQIMI